MIGFVRVAPHTPADDLPLGPYGGPAVTKVPSLRTAGKVRIGSVARLGDPVRYRLVDLAPVPDPDAPHMGPWSRRSAS